MTLKALDIELQNQHLFADALLQVMLNGKPGLLHIEFQTYNDDKMEKRVLEYNVLPLINMNCRSNRM